MTIRFAVKDAGRESLTRAICGMLEQDAVYNDTQTVTQAVGGYIVNCSSRQRNTKGGTVVNIRFNMNNAGRRAFVRAVGEILGLDVVYNGTPTFSYSIGEYIIDREGALTFPNNIFHQESTDLIMSLRERGYEVETDGMPDFQALQVAEHLELWQAREYSEPSCKDDPRPRDTTDAENGIQMRYYCTLYNDPMRLGREELFSAVDDVEATRKALEHCVNGVVLSRLIEIDSNHTPLRTVDPLESLHAVSDIASSDEPPDSNSDDSDKLVIDMPLGDFTPESLDRLRKIVASKESLLKKAFGADAVPIRVVEDKVRFPWFTVTGAEGEIDSNLRFVTALCKMARESMRITAKEKPVENEKFDMRIFLIRLGFVGPEFKTARKILMRNLSGNSAWKAGQPPEQDSTHNSEEDEVGEQ